MLSISDHACNGVRACNADGLIVGGENCNAANICNEQDPIDAETKARGEAVLHDWLQNSGAFQAQVKFARANGHQLTRARHPDGVMSARADYFHFHAVVILAGERTGTILGAMAHAHEYDGMRVNNPNNFNIWTVIGSDGVITHRYVPNPADEDSDDGIKIMKFAKNFLRAGERTGDVQVNFRLVDKADDCDPDEKAITVTLASGEEKVLCYKFSTFPDMLKALASGV
jgi:hypothetical protein